MNTKIDMGFKFDGPNRDSIQLQKMVIDENGMNTKRSKITKSMLEQEFSKKYSFFEATVFLMTVIKIELFWNIMKSTADADLILIAAEESIYRHEDAKTKFPLNEAFLELTDCVVYGKIIIVSKRLLDSSISNRIIPFNEWGGLTSILQIK
jgi:hypothetical protein